MRFDEHAEVGRNELSAGICLAIAVLAVMLAVVPAILI